jgi:hypothetical protein
MNDRRGTPRVVKLLLACLLCLAVIAGLVVVIQQLTR